MDLADQPLDVTETERLVLSRPSRADIDALFVIESDPRLWTHYPSLRHTEHGQTRALIELWASRWAESGLGPWTVRIKNSASVIGARGCTLIDGMVWNLGYRLAAEAHDRGYATEVASEAIRQARAINPTLPAVASLLEHNFASKRVASKLGLKCVYRGHDTSNPHPSAIRLVYADRRLTTDELPKILS